MASFAWPSVMVLKGSRLLVARTILKYHNTIFVRQNCSCTGPMEASYYSSALVKFPSVCFYCGMGEDSLIDDVELKRKYGIVRPLCSVCKGKGRTHKVSHLNNVTNKKLRIE